MYLLSKSCCSITVQSYAVVCTLKICVKSVQKSSLFKKDRIATEHKQTVLWVSISVFQKFKLIYLFININFNSSVT